MSEFLDRISKLSPQRLALLADELNERLLASERRRKVPLAIVGVGCRLPGGINDPEGFWKLLSEGVDAVGEVPRARWNIEEFHDPNPEAPGKMATRWGGFIEGQDQFDPKFFGIAPAEAVCMDPQQRLLLETAWEALEDAGIAPGALAGTATGVFVGLCNGDYSQVALNAPREQITPYHASGLSHAVAAGRISYVLGLQGPSLAVDTSCSASLVAVHLACQSLRLGECDTALAGGANLILSPEITIALSQSRMMAPDGRCKSFSDAANGFVRGEGGGMIVLKRLPDAIRDGNRILAVVRGSACNQDGRSSGLTAPNGPSQEAVVSAALADAGMEPDEVQYIEAHGTGTSLGDPIEAGALNAVFGARSRSRTEPLWIGSVKTNFGHLESAAGIAGLIKLVLAIRQGKIPASLHLGKPSSHIDWERLPLKVPTRLEKWESGEKKRVGGVSSFGFSGTNAHVIVEEYSQGGAAGNEDARALLFMLSAKTETALASVAARLRRYLIDHPLLPLFDVAGTLNRGRSHFECRAAVTAASYGELVERLDGFLKQDGRKEIATGRVVGHSPRIAFVFGGENCFEAGCGRELYERAPLFRRAIDRCEDILKNELGGSLLSSLYSATNGNAADRNAAEFALQYALAGLWRSCGVEPAVVIGLGVGEYVAACVAGVLSQEDGLRLAMAHGDENSARHREVAREVGYREPQIPFISEPGRGRVNSAEYWLGRADAGPLATSVLEALAQERTAANLVIGGDAALRRLANPGRKNWLASLGEGSGDCGEFLKAAGALYVLGCDLNMNGFYGDVANTVSLPTYPFERERYWLDTNGRTSGAGAERGVEHVEVQAETCEEWIYDLVWEPRPLHLKTPGLMDEELIEGMAETPASAELKRVTEATTAAMPVYSTYILRAFESAGFSRKHASAFTVDELGRQLKVIPARLRLLARLVGILAEDGLVERQGSRFRFLDSSSRPDPDGELQRLGDEYPECRIEMNILRRCGKGLLAVLRGEYDPMQLVFADGSIEETEQVYQNSPVCRFFNDKAGRIVRSAVERIAGRPARILEIGGGTGATTASIVSAVYGKDFDYCFTDISAAFLSRARVKFSDVSSMEFRVLNIENYPAEQDFEAGGYDIVLAANVLHATTDLRRTLGHVRKLLRPGGVLVLIEGVYADRWLDMTLGLTDGWWRFIDYDLRPEHPLISAEEWKGVLREAGMSSSRTISYINGDGSASQQTVIVAEADAEETASVAVSRKLDREWMILADESGVGDALCSLLARTGEQCEMIWRPRSSAESASLFRKLETRTGKAALEIVYLWGMDVGGPIDAMGELGRSSELCTGTLVHLMQAMMAGGGTTAHLSIVTRGAEATASFSPSAGGAVESLAWGVGRVFSLEAPERYRALIDLDPMMTTEDAARSLFAELTCGDREDQIAYRGGERVAARLRRSSLDKLKVPTSPARLRGDGSYLLVGGLGGVGLKLARWAAEQRPGHLILLGRTGTGSSAGAFAAERLKAIEEIQALGVKVTVVEGDVASLGDMKNLFVRFDAEFPPLRGIFHAATAVSGVEIGDLTDEQIETMLRAKVSGTWVLHELTKTLPLDFFVAFSSIAAVMGAKGMAHYAAANHFLDAFAYFRRAAGLPMLSVNWGSWDVLRLVSQEGQTYLAETGILPMGSDKTLALMGELIASPRAQVMVANINWEVLKPLLETKRTRPLLEYVGTGRAKTRKLSAVSGPAAGSLHSVAGMSPEAQTKFIEAFVLEQAARVLGFRGGELPPVDVPLTDIGLDSLMAVDLKNRLQTGLGRELSPTVVFDYPTVAELVGMLETMLWAVHGGAADDLAAAEKDEIRI